MSRTLPVQRSGEKKEVGQVRSAAPLMKSPHAGPRTCTLSIMARWPGQNGKPRLPPSLSGRWAWVGGWGGGGGNELALDELTAAAPLLFI